MVELPILKIQRFSTQDGPGIRTTVFLQGCPLKCKWCHNPESQVLQPLYFFTPTLCVACGACENVCKNSVHVFDGNTHFINRANCARCMQCVSVCAYNALEPCVTPMRMEQVLEIVQKDAAFYGKDGGLTLSGGEPLLFTENALSLLSLAKQSGISTAVETCGYFDSDYIPSLVKNVDLFLYDVKDTVDARHIENTGVSNVKIIENLLSLDALGGKSVLRCIMLRGVNTDDAHLDGLVTLYKRLKNCLRIEIFSYHHYGKSKYDSLGISYNGKQDWIVPKKELREISARLKKQGVPCKIQF